jgi:hypothetical protein
MEMTPETCRAARALVDMSQGELARLAQVSRATIIDFERGARAPLRATRAKMQEALARSGIVFLAGGVVKSDRERTTAARQAGDRRLARIVRLLQRHERKLRALGVARLSLFGSTVRGEATPESDVDIMVDLDPSRRLDLLDYAGIASELRRMLDLPVDVARRDKLKPHVATNALADAVRVF